MYAMLCAVTLAYVATACSQYLFCRRVIRGIVKPLLDVLLPTY